MFELIFPFLKGHPKTWQVNSNDGFQEYAGRIFAYSRVFLAFDVLHMQLHISEKSNCSCQKLKIEQRFSQELTLVVKKKCG